MAQLLPSPPHQQTLYFPTSATIPFQERPAKDDKAAPEDMFESAAGPGANVVTSGVEAAFEPGAGPGANVVNSRVEAAFEPGAGPGAGVTASGAADAFGAEYALGAEDMFRLPEDEV